MLLWRPDAVAYPFVYLPTLAEFVEVAKAEHGYVLTEQFSFTLNGKKRRGFFLHDKKKPQIRVFLRDYSNRKDEHLTPDRIRHFCRRLKMPAERWLPPLG